MNSPPPNPEAGPADGRDWSAYFQQHRDQLVPLLTLCGLVAVLIWGHWNSLCRTAHFWDQDLYSHGYLIPIFSLLLLWLRYEPFEPATMGARWAGLGLLLLGQVMRLVTTNMAIVTAEMVSFVPSLAGVFLLVGGWSLIRWSWPAIVFLLFMFPLPSFIQSGLLVRLQYLATIASTFVLQTIGIAAFSEGNRITIGELQMGVVDACSGLRMSTNLLALVVAMVFIAKRPWWDRLILLLSAIPIALVVNVVRITATSIFHLTLEESELGDTFHSWAGFLMMPLALAIIFVELKILSSLVVDEEDGANLAAAGIGIRSHSK